MAEFDNPDDDIFADIYDDDEPAPSSLVEAPPAAEPAPVAPITQPLEQQSAQPQSFGNDSAMNDATDQGYGGSNGYGGNDMGYGGHEETPEPVGMKEDGKMFIGGLNWETTDQSLKDYFSQFGEVLECTVMRDAATGRSRGFGFLTFKDPKTVNIVMVKEHHLDGKIIDPKRAIPREEQERTAKIFVGGVSQECTEAYFKEFFMKFGRVIDATLMMDKDTGRPRGFGFVTFDGEDAVDRTLQQPLAIHGKQIEVKRAEPRGNVHDEKGGGKFNKRNRGGDQQAQYDGGQEQFQGGAPTGGQNTNGMSQAQMAAYWFKMQEYFRNMQTMMARNMAAQAQGPMQGMMGGMNPAMMQQMMMAQRQGMMSPNNMQQMGGPNGAPLSPGSMQQMMLQGGGGQQGGGEGGNYNNNGRGGSNFNSQEQMAFEQQKYEKQQMARMQQSQYQSQQGGGYGPTSWEDMYDDVPPPNAAPSGPSGGQGGRRGGYGGGGSRRGGGGQKHGGDGGYQQGGGGNAPPNAPSAPANAPTGPRNAGRVGANYRGGGRGHNRGYRPY